LERTKQVTLEGKTYTVKRFNAREKANIYNKASKFDAKTRMVHLTVGDLMLWTVVEGVVEPQMTIEQVEALDGPLLDSLFTAVNDFNTGPLSG